MNNINPNGLNKANIGCWKFKIPGWINVDIDPEFGEVVADARSLPFEDGSMEELNAGHLLEHASPGEFEAWLLEWRRVLKEGGKITITVPDIRKSLDLVNEGKMSLEALSAAVYGQHDRPEQIHKSVFDVTIAKGLLNTYFRDAEDIGHTPYAPFRVPWQSCFQAFK